MDEKDPKWAHACMEKFSWIDQICKTTPQGQELKPFEFAIMADEDRLEVKTTEYMKATYDSLRVELRNRNESKAKAQIPNYTLIQDYSVDLTWRDLFMKLCFEQMLEYFPQH